MVSTSGLPTRTYPDIAILSTGQQQPTLTSQVHARDPPIMSCYLTQHPPIRDGEQTDMTAPIPCSYDTLQYVSVRYQGQVGCLASLYLFQIQRVVTGNPAQSSILATCTRMLFSSSRDQMVTIPELSPLARICGHGCRIVTTDGKMYPVPSPA